MDKSTVLVTGGTGFVASWLVKELLEQGQDARITVRDSQKEEKYAHLAEIEKQTPGTLKVYEADLLKEGSFDEAVSGCEYVFHTASPFIINGIKDANKELIEPAIKGTQNVLSSVNKVESVKRVVLTSSVVSIFGDHVDMKGKESFSEGDWNTTSSINHQPYSYSKTIAEKEAWKMMKEQDQWDLVTINPSFVMGPTLSKRTDSTSISTILSFLTGGFKTGVPNLASGIVDVRDIAKAHMLAAFTPKAEGRYIISGGEITFMEIAQLIEKNFPGEYPLPKRVVPKPLIWLIAPTVGLTREYVSKNVGYPVKFDTSKSKGELGMTYRSIETTFIDQVNQIKRDGLVK
ncbi:SDR family oxidoreductase [Rossellomorea aquimaris]|uniref:SDR family oxidoreductase n=1 Tax=Rossellomorea aquimaris TaxID=189382 RepID=UPI0007D08B23|nr:aldehyde reductase [Rossellomorea aquimaris]